MKEKDLACQLILRSKHRTSCKNSTKTSLFFLSFFIVFKRLCYLSVVLWLDKGDFPENLRTACLC